jgi:hypothetical protein
LPLGRPRDRQVSFLDLFQCGEHHLAPPSVFFA